MGRMGRRAGQGRAGQGLGSWHDDDDDDEDDDNHLHHHHDYHAALFRNMSAAVWPHTDAAQLAREQTASQARELEWLLRELRSTLQSLKAGFEECAALLAPSETGSTLVLSSVRSESLKGLVTRVGTRIVKGVSSHLLLQEPRLLTSCSSM